MEGFMHFFNISTNLTNGPFVVGYEDQPDNFYLKGETSGKKPKVSCRIFDSTGNQLFSIKNNTLAKSPTGKFKFTSEKDNLQVTDVEGNLLLRIETHQDAHGNRITFIHGKFFDREGKLAASGDERGLLVNCPLRM